jgi:surface antigen
VSASFETLPIDEQSQGFPLDGHESSCLNESLGFAKRLIGRSVLVLGIATGLVSGETALMPPSAAMADDGGYPDADAALKDIATYTWWKDANGNHVYNTGEDISSRGYAYRNCTDWVAYRIPQLVGKPVATGLHNAQDWDNNAPSTWTVDTSPEPGDIAQSETTAPYGHVGVVESVNKDSSGAVTSIVVSEYNKAGTGLYTSLTYTDSGGVFWRDTAHTKKWDHFLDLNGTGKGINGEVIGGGGGGPAPLPWISLAGDWTGKGYDSIGLFNPNSNIFYLRNSNTAGNADITVAYGNPNWIPITGDWDGNGTDTVGLYDPITSTFHLRNSNTAGNADITVNFGNANWTPIVGDWDGNSTDTIGVYNAGAFYLRNSNSAGPADLAFTYGNSGWTPLAGDWDGDGITTIGVSNNASTFYLRNSNTSGNADITFAYGNSIWKPVMGDWGGDLTTTVGVYDHSASTFYLRDTNTTGGADMTVPYGNPN